MNRGTILRFAALLFSSVSPSCLAAPNSMPPPTPQTFPAFLTSSSDFVVLRFDGLVSISTWVVDSSANTDPRAYAFCSALNAYLSGISHRFSKVSCIDVSEIQRLDAWRFGVAKAVPIGNLASYEAITFAMSDAFTGRMVATATVNNPSSLGEKKNDKEFAEFAAEEISALLERVLSGDKADAQRTQVEM
jgi:hypothetical protein